MQIKKQDDVWKSFEINLFSPCGLFSAENYPQNCTCQIGVNTDGTIGDLKTHLKTHSGEKLDKCNTKHRAVTCQIGVNTLWCNWAFGLFCTARNSTISPLPSHTACISDSTAIFLSYTRILTKMVVNLCRQWYDGILLSGVLILLEHPPKQAHSKRPFLRKMIRLLILLKMVAMLHIMMTVRYKWGPET